MVFIIIFSIADVMYVFYQRLTAPPLFLLEVNDIFQLFGTVMVVLIAIEIFINVRLYHCSSVTLTRNHLLAHIEENQQGNEPDA
jgi:uncharacterized membrane protein (DUF373 family)